MIIHSFCRQGDLNLGKNHDIEAGRVVALCRIAVKDFRETLHEPSKAELCDSLSPDAVAAGAASCSFEAVFRHSVLMHLLHLTKDVSCTAGYCRDA